MPQLTATTGAAAAAPTLPSEDDVEKATDQVEVISCHKARHYLSIPILSHDHDHVNWSKLVIAFCFGSALEIVHQSQQFSHSQFPSTLYLVLCFAISLSFSSIFVAMFIGSKFSKAAQVLELVGVFAAVTAFFLAITSPFPVSLSCTIWALYAISLLAILICHAHAPTFCGLLS